MELNRILRPGGYFIWSATPVYRNDQRDQNVWKGFQINRFFFSNIVLVVWVCDRLMIDLI